MKPLRPGVCPETKLRIDVAVAAYAYEVENDPIVSDAEFDAMCARVRPTVPTGRFILDAFFQREFKPHTGQWVHSHPDIAGLRRIYLMKKPAQESVPVKHPCSACGRDVTVNPLYGGCHC